MGIPVTDEAGQRLGHSVTAAKQGIFQVVISRIGMAIPAMGEAWLGGAQEAWREEGLVGGSQGFLITQSASLGRRGGAGKEAFPQAPAVCSRISLTALFSPQPFPR